MFKKSVFCLVAVSVLNAICVQPALSAQSVDVASSLYRAASSQGLRGVQRLMQAGYNLEKTNASGNTALCLASLYHDDQAFRVLLKAGASTQADCFAAQGKRYPQQKQTQAGNGKMIYLGSGLSDTIYGENRKLIESEKSETVWPLSYTVGTALLIAGGVGIALAAGGGGGGGGGGYVPSPKTTPVEEILSGEIPSCLGGTWSTDGDGYSCTCPSGTQLIHGACVEDKSSYQTDNVVNNDDVTANVLLAELGAKLTNDGNVVDATTTPGTSTPSTSQAKTETLVGLKVEGFSSKAYSGDLTPDKKLNAAASSEAVNNGTITLTQLDSTAPSIYGIQAVSGATALNSKTGVISLNVQSSNPAYAMYAEEEGYGLSNLGKINLNLSGHASDTFGLYTVQDRGMVNQGTILITVTDPHFDETEIDDVAGIFASDAQNSGKIFLRRGEETPTNEDNLNISGMLVKDAGKAENTSKGIISLDVTKTPFYTHGMYANNGSSGMVNEGRIEIFGDLSNREILPGASSTQEPGIGGAYAMRWTGGFGSILNDGEIETRTCIKDINGVCMLDETGNIRYKNLSISGDAYLELLSGFKGTITNEADLLLYVSNKSDATSAWTLKGINLIDQSNDTVGIKNSANIKVKVTKDLENNSNIVKKGSNAIGISATMAYIENTGNIYMNSSTDNLNLYAIDGYGSNGKYSAIEILGGGKDTSLYGIAKAAHTDESNGFSYIYNPNSENNGSISLEHYSTGGMFGLAGQNYGSISLLSKPEKVGPVRLHSVWGMVGGNNSGSISVSLQKGSYVMTTTDPSSETYDIPNTALIRAYDGGANVTNSGPISFITENRRVNTDVSGHFINEDSVDEDGIITTTSGPGTSTNYYSFFGGAYGIEANVPSIQSTYNITNSSLISLDASSKTPEGYNMAGSLIGINAYAYNVTNQDGARIYVNLNGAGAAIGTYVRSTLYSGETTPSIYTTTNNGTIDIRATNSEYTPLLLDNLVVERFYGNTTLTVTPSTVNNIEEGDSEEVIYEKTHFTQVPFNVIGMVTNSIAVNNGHILMQVAGDAKAAAMVAYDGGVVVNNGEIKFTGNPNNFTALYGTGYRTIKEETVTEETVTTITTTQYSTVYNNGTIIINALYYPATNTKDVLGGGDDARCAKMVEPGDTPTTANQEVVSCSGTTCDVDDHNYYPGTKLENLQTTSSTTSLSLTTTNSIEPFVVTLNEGVNYVSEENGSFEAEGGLVKGSVTAGLTNILGKNAAVYVADGRGSGAIVGNGDSSLLSLTSASYLFDASFQTNENNSNGLDIVMTMKSFDDVVDNKSLANFLASNYASGNNEAFFDDIKSIGNGAAFKSAMNNLTGQNTIAKFTHEDLTAMREINFAMNEAMFANADKQTFETQGVVNGFAFKNDNHSSGQYALGTKRISPKWKIGYAMSNTKIKTDDGNDTTRRNEMFQVFAPIGYEHKGIKLISTPQIGFARGHYTRKGYNDTSYKGVIEKRIFAFMNEARYPIEMGNFEIAPTVEFNAIAYNQKGSEDNKAYSLKMPSDNQLSVEAGMGLYANKTIGNIKFNTGLMMYREFADPYNVKMGMNGMDGTFNLYDDNREYRGVASFGFDYNVDGWNLYGKVQHFMESDNHTNVKTGLKYSF